MKYLLSCFLASFLLIVNVHAQSDELTIRKVLSAQQSAWNNGDLEAFMQAYWENDSLLFVGKAGPSYGWQNTLDYYRHNYDTIEKMGTLSYTILQARKLSDEYFFVLGNWHLDRKAGEVGGSFTLLFRRFKDGWKIVVDHSS